MMKREKRRGHQVALTGLLYKLWCHSKKVCVFCCLFSGDRRTRTSLSGFVLKCCFCHWTNNKHLIHCYFRLIDTVVIRQQKPPPPERMKAEEAVYSIGLFTLQVFPFQCRGLLWRRKRCAHTNHDGDISSINKLHLTLLFLCFGCESSEYKRWPRTRNTATLGQRSLSAEGNVFRTVQCHRWVI